MFHTFEKPRVQRPRLSFQHAAANLDPGLGQTLHAAPRHFRVRVLHAGHHARDAGTHQRIGAGRRVAVVAARFERHVHRGATGLVTGGAQGVGFGMRFAGAFVPTFTDHLPIAHDHAAHSRVGVSGVQAVARQF
ncbi:hypothetical protein [Pseudomonas sp. 31 E 6]|nr:hypothetical protein [Pseudomonas sp. 31 E 6]